MFTYVVPPPVEPVVEPELGSSLVGPDGVGGAAITPVIELMTHKMGIKCNVQPYLKPEHGSALVTTTYNVVVKPTIIMPWCRTRSRVRRVAID